MTLDFKENGKYKKGVKLDKTLFRYGCYQCDGENNCPRFTNAWGLEKKLDGK